MREGISQHTHLTSPFTLSLFSHTSLITCAILLSSLSPSHIQTLRMLEDFKIPYNEIHFGQPYADVYVDASVACSALDTEKDLGWRVAGARNELTPGMVAARHFNNVQIEGDYVIKTVRSASTHTRAHQSTAAAQQQHAAARSVSSSFSTAARSRQAARAFSILPFITPTPLPPPSPHTHTQAARSLLRGEIFFYEHLPSDIAHLFPSLVSSFSATQPRSPHRPPDEAAGFNVKDGPSANAPPSATPGSSEGRSTKPITAKALTPAELQSQVAAKLKVDDEADPACAAAAAATAKSAAPERDESGVASLTLQRIKGVTFSHLVTNRSLTPGRLVLLLKALRQLHSSSGDPNTLRPLSEISICANYLPKLRKRWKANKDSIYAGLSSDAPRMFAQVRASKHACSTQASAASMHSTQVSRLQ